MFLLFLSLFLAPYIVFTETTSIPQHIVFNEDGVHNRDTFKTRLQRLRDTAYLYTSQESLLYSTGEELHPIYVSLFDEFIDLFNRSYHGNQEEYNKRFLLFKESLGRHFMLNSQVKARNETATYGINKFADWTENEFMSLLGPQKTVTKPPNPTVAFMEEIPAEDCVVYRTKKDSVDWRSKLTSIKDQKSCGSCWAFVGSEQVESYATINGQPLHALSPQELLSCSPSLGCQGGNTCDALKWLRDTNKVLVSEKSYPYEEKESFCRYNKLAHVGVSVKNVCGCTRLAQDEEIMLFMLSQKGPLAVNVDAVLWRDYTGGIIQHHCTNQKMNHAVQIVAYYLNDGPVHYYVARNQWGASWGEDGFVRIKYGQNVCGVAEQPSFIAV